jgi:hypothetical protein
MSPDDVPTTSITHLTSRAGRTAPVPADRSIVRHVWRAVRDVFHGVAAGALIGHRREVPPDHLALRRRLDHEEVERRLAVLYPRS